MKKKQERSLMVAGARLGARSEASLHLRTYVRFFAVLRFFCRLNDMTATARKSRNFHLITLKLCHLLLAGVQHVKRVV